MAKYVISYNPYKKMVEVKKGEDKFPNNSEICAGLNKDSISEWFDESVSWPGIGKVLEDDNNASVCKIVFNGWEKDFKELEDYFQKYKSDTEFIISKGILLNDDILLKRLNTLLSDAKNKKLLSNKEISAYEEIVKKLKKRSDSPTVFYESVEEIIQNTRIEGKIVQLSENISQSDIEVEGLKERINSAEDRKKEDFENDLDDLEVTEKIKKRINRYVNKINEPIDEVRDRFGQQKTVSYTIAAEEISNFINEIDLKEKYIDDNVKKLLEEDIYSKEDAIYNQYTLYIKENNDIEALQLGEIKRLKNFNMKKIIQWTEVTKNRNRRKKPFYISCTINGMACEDYFEVIDLYSKKKYKLEDVKYGNWLSGYNYEKEYRDTGEEYYYIKTDDLINEIEKIEEIEKQNVEKLLNRVSNGCEEFAESIRNNMNEIYYNTSNEKTVSDIRKKEKERESKEKQLRELENFLDSLKKVAEIC